MAKTITVSITIRGVNENLSQEEIEAGVAKLVLKFPTELKTKINSVRVWKRDKRIKNGLI